MKDPIEGYEVAPMEVQTRATGLTHEESMAAYAAVSKRFGLRGPQRSQLDRSPLYSPILVAAHEGKWDRAEQLIRHRESYITFD